LILLTGTFAVVDGGRQLQGWAAGQSFPIHYSCSQIQKHHI